MVQVPLHHVKHPKPRTLSMLRALKPHPRFVQNHPGGLERILKAAGGQCLGILGGLDCKGLDCKGLGFRV